MMAYLLRRLLLLIPTLFFVSSLVFFLIHLVPGDPVDLILGEQALSVDKEAFRQMLHLDRPLGEQYLLFFKQLFQGDLGVSLFDRRAVADILFERFPASLELALTSLGIALLMSLSLGVFAAIRKDTPWDRGALLFSLLGISIPSFWLGPLLILFFSIFLSLLPVSGRSNIASLILPSLTLGTGMAALLTRMTRSSLLETLQEDYVRTARAKGVPEKRVILRHALRNALNPVVTIIGLQFGSVLTGAIVTEKIFAWPGVGSLLVLAIERRDYPVLQGCILLIAVTYCLVNLMTDLFYSKLDPRIRYSA
ncbi:MAG: ABC transporter permease [Deltaproteobacteria bacterium]|nr:ABC transporter permease [Deltaproteobacteria bacterium]